MHAVIGVEVVRAHHPIGNLIGLTLSTAVSVAGFGQVMNQVELSTTMDSLTAIQLMGAIGALVGALVFVHRLLMKSEAEKLLKMETLYTAMLEARASLYMAMLAEKDQTARVQKESLDRMEAALTDAQATCSRLQEHLLLAVQGKPLPSFREP